MALELAFASVGLVSQSITTRSLAPATLPTNSLRLQIANSTARAFSAVQNPFNRANLKCQWRTPTGPARCKVSGTARDAELSTENVQRKSLRRKKLAIFVSGGGSNFRALHQATLSDQIYGDCAVLVTDKPSCQASDYAQENNIPVVIFPKSKTEPSGLSSGDLISTLRYFEIDFLLLAGYLKLLPVELVQSFPRSILNIHPSLLPAFGGKGYYGMKVHKAVIASGARFSGPTIHFVDEKYDTGKILAQRVVPVLANDTTEDLAARVLQEEHSLYVEVVAAVCEDRIFWREDGVPLIKKSWDTGEYC